MLAFTGFLPGIFFREGGGGQNLLLCKERQFKSYIRNLALIIMRACYESNWQIYGHISSLSYFKWLVLLKDWHSMLKTANAVFFAWFFIIVFYLDTVKFLILSWSSFKGKVTFEKQSNKTLNSSVLVQYLLRKLRPSLHPMKGKRGRVLPDMH